MDKEYFIELNEVKNRGTWSEQAAVLNDNFRKIQVAEAAVEELAEEVEGYKALLESKSMEIGATAFDAIPTKGSVNPVTSDGLHRTTVMAERVIGNPAGDWDKGTAETYIDTEIVKVKNWVSNTPVTNVVVVETLPASGKANTLYRVKGTNAYSEYGWDGSKFVLLAVKDYGIDDEPVAGSDNLVRSGGVAKETCKILHRSVLASDEGIKAIEINRAIKELYISSKDISDFSNFCIGAIRRNYSSVSGDNKWDVIFYDSTTPTEYSAVLVFNSVNKNGSLELLNTENSYCLIDWSECKDGEYIIAEINPQYNIDTEYVSDINNFPIIKQFKQLEKIESKIVLCSTLLDKDGNITIPEKITIQNGVYLRENGELGHGATYGITDYIYIKNIGKVEWKGSLVAGSINVAAVVFYDKDKNFISSISVGRTGTLTTNTTSISVDVPDSAYYVRCSSKAEEFSLTCEISSIDILRKETLLYNIEISTIQQRTISVENKNPHSIFADSAKGEKIPYLDKAIKKLNVVLKNDEYNKDNLCLGSLRKNYGEHNIWSVVLYDDASDNSHNIYVYSNDKENKVEYIAKETEFYSFQILIDWREVNDGESLGVVSGQYLLNYDYISKSDFEFFSTFDEQIIKKENTFDVSWVDDDFNLNAAAKAKELCKGIGCKCDFAVIPDFTRGTGDYPLDSDYYFTSEKLSLIKECEKEGFHIEMHPPHKGWYSSGGGGVYQGRAWVEQSMVKTIKCFNENGILHSNCIVYPGGSSSFDDCVQMVKSWLDFGITASGSYNEKNLTSKYQLQRLFINLSNRKTKSYYKNKIKEAYDAGAWLIIGTHTADFYSDMTTVDESTMSWPNLVEIIEYANSLSIIKPVRAVFNKRKLMLEL